MHENEEALARQQAESLRCFAEDIYKNVGSRIPSAVLTHENELCYTLEFSTADSFSLVLIGSETNNADCLQAMLVFDGFTDLLISDRRPLESFKQRVTDLVCAIVGRKMRVTQVIKSHSERRIEYSVFKDGTWETVSSERKLSGFGALLLLWKNSEESLNFDLTIKNRQ